LCFSYFFLLCVPLCLSSSFLLFVFVNVFPPVCFPLLCVFSSSVSLCVSPLFFNIMWFFLLFLFFFCFLLFSYYAFLCVFSSGFSSFSLLLFLLCLFCGFYVCSVFSYVVLCCSSVFLLFSYVFLLFISSVFSYFPCRFSVFHICYYIFILWVFFCVPSGLSFVFIFCFYLLFVSVVSTSGFPLLCSSSVFSLLCFSLRCYLLVSSVSFFCLFFCFY